MKRILYSTKLLVTATVTACCLLVACSKRLELAPESQLSDANFWQSTDDLVSACNALYEYLPGITNNTAAVWSDDGYGTGANSISDGTRSVPATDGNWSTPYTFIRRCNTILEKSGKVNGDAKDIRRYRGEAYFFRAYAYSDLVKRYGDVPLILRTFDVFDTLTQAARTPRLTVIDQIYADLDSAAASLPTPSALPAAQYGRISKTAALALKGRVALFEGTRNKYHGLGDATKHLEAGLAAVDSIIASNQHALYTYTANPDSSYYHLFQYAGVGRNNKENILVRLYGENQANNIASHNYTRAQLEQGQVTPTRAMVDAYLYQDGLPIGKSALQTSQDSTMAEFMNRDPRMWMTVFNKRAWFTNGLYTPSFAFAPTGYKVRKYFIGADWSTQVSYVHNIILRYAEVLLTYAELKYELQGSIPDADLDKSINVLRARAKMPKLTNAFVTANGLDMLEEIRRERRVELAFEGENRYWDLIRWKTAETELPKAVKGSKVFLNELPSSERTSAAAKPVDTEGFVVVHEASRRTFQAGRDYWWPLPTRDLGLNLKLTQNPNW